METFSTLLTHCAGNSPVTGELPSQRPMTQSFDVFFDLRLNQLMSKQWWDCWFETPSIPSWRHCIDELFFPTLFKFDGNLVLVYLRYRALFRYRILQMPRQGRWCAKCYSDHVSITWMRAEWTFHWIWITMENWFATWAQGYYGLINMIQQKTFF